jgi:hypothetical protein
MTDQAPATGPARLTSRGQAGHPHRLPQQDGPALRDQAPAVRRHHDAIGACAILHLKSAFDSNRTGPSTSPILPGQKHFFIYIDSRRLFQAKARG